MAEDLKTIQTVDLSPFKCMVLTIGELPTSFVESMTYYEALAWLDNYLEKTLIPTINNNAEAVKELQALYIELHDYVENYFDNLDVQEEINNKLDEMAEEGTLQEIITTYIQSNVAWTFDTVADMSDATNLVSGSYAQTLGFHSINDGGAALYFITDSGTANGKDVIACGELFANLVIPDTIRPEIYGAYGDGTHDDTTAIQYALNKHLPIHFEKQYVTSSTVTISGDGLSISSQPSSKITYSGNSCAIKITDCSRSDIELGCIDALSGTCISLQATNNDDRVANITLATDNLRASSHCIEAIESGATGGFINEIRILRGRWMAGDIGLYLTSYKLNTAGINDWKIYNVLVEGVTTGIDIEAQASCRIDTILLCGLRYKESYTNLLVTHGQVYSILFIGAGRFNVGDFHPTYFTLSNNTYGAIVAPYDNDQQYFYNIRGGKILSAQYQFPTTITTNSENPADLNSYLTCGIYNCESNVSTLLNSPATGAFQMDVRFFNSTYLMQTITIRDTGTIFHRRVKADGTQYQSWYKIESTVVS